MRTDYLIIGLVLGSLGIAIIAILWWAMAIGCIIGIPLLIIGAIFFIISFTNHDQFGLLPSYKMCPRCGRLMDYYAPICNWCGCDCRYSYMGLPAAYPPPPAYPPFLYTPPQPVYYGVPQAPHVGTNCAKCGQPLEQDWKLCPWCGHKLQSTKRKKSQEQKSKRSEK